MQFTHLHTHSEYSLLDGLAKIDDLLAKTKEYGMDSLAITDHGSMHGVIEFYTKAKKAGIKPIIGMEGYLAKRSRFDKEARVDVEPFHIVLLAKNLEGYQNLIKLSTRGHLEGHYYKPRLDKELLREKANGLICLSACVDGEIPRALIDGQYKTAQKLVAEYLDIFGKENFFLEIQKHQIKNQETANQGVLKLAQEFNVPIVATNDIHYVDKNDAFAQDALLALQTKQTINDPKRKLTMIDSPTFYLRSPQEMSELFYEHPEALENTQRIVDACNLEIPLGKFIFPEFPVPGGKSSAQYLRDIVWQKAKEKFSQLTPEISDRLSYELDIICTRGYATYFLIFADIADFCRAKGIITNTRGSAVGSLTLFVLGVTNLNPISYSIPFERFLNPQRPSPPDIDYDIQDVRRDEVIDYVRNKYGDKHVAQIVTFGRMEARAAVRDATRVLAHGYAVGDRLAKMIPFGHQGFHFGIEDALEGIPEFRAAYENEEDAKSILDLALKLEGVARHASTHAAGVVISDKPITSYVPLMRDSKAGKIMTQFDMYSLDLNVSDDALGLLKMDFLGMRILNILQKSIDIVKVKKGIKIDISEIPLSEQKVYEMISAGQTTGVFQLEGSGMRRVAKDLKPNRVEDLMAMVALFRPGPMDLIPKYIEGKKNPQTVSYAHPCLKEVLADTYGVLVYQEQCLQIASVMAGYKLGEADLLRRAIGKKKKKLMQKEKKKFIAGAKEKGYSKKEAEDVFSFIEKFTGYGFNRGHAASYGMLVYQTAYMKALYPIEYMCAMLTCEAGNADKISLAVNECRRMGIPVLPPDVNHSGVSFEIKGQRSRPKAGPPLAEAISLKMRREKEQAVKMSSYQAEQLNSILFGLSAIKNVGQGACEAMVAERKNNGPFASLSDFCRRVNLYNVNKKVLESLIRCGAMDEFGSRSAQLKALSDFMNLGSQYQKRRSLGQVGLFESTDTEILPAKKIPEIKEFPQAQLLAWEKELLGLYLSEHPKEKEMQKLQNFVSHPLSEVSLEDVDKNLILGGMISDIRIIVTRKGNKEMAFVRLQDEIGSLEAIVFPKVFQASKKFLKEDEVVLVRGRIDYKEESDLKILVDKMVPLAKAEELISGQQSAVSNQPKPPTTYHQLPTSDHQPQTTNYQPQTSNHQLPTSNHQLPTSNHQLPTSNHQLPTSDDGPPAWLQPEADSVTINFSNPHLEICVPAISQNYLKQTLGQVKTILSQHPGETPVVLFLQNGSAKPTQIPLSFRVSCSEKLKSALYKI